MQTVINIWTVAGACNVKAIGSIPRESKMKMCTFKCNAKCVNVIIKSDKCFNNSCEIDLSMKLILNTNIDDYLLNLEA